MVTQKTQMCRHKNSDESEQKTVLSLSAKKWKMGGKIERNTIVLITTLCSEWNKDTSIGRTSRNIRKSNVYILFGKRRLAWQPINRVTHLFGLSKEERTEA